MNFLLFVCVQILVCFKVFDNDQDGYLSKDEISKMVEVMLFICEDNIATQNKEATDESGINNILLITILFKYLNYLFIFSERNNCI